VAGGGALTARPRPERAWPWLVLAVLVLATVLRGIGLGGGLWYDEILTLVRYVRRPLAAIVTTWDSQNQHMLYSVLARASVAAFGESAWALRLPAALFGVAGIGAVCWFGARTTGRAEALVAALLLAVSYHHVWFSQNARGYTMLMTGAVLSTGLLLPLLRGSPAPGARRLIALYALAMGLSLYTHATAAFIVAGHGLVWLGLLARRRLAAAGRWHAFLAFALAGVLAALLYAPVLGAGMRAVTAPTMAGLEVEWKSPLWMLAETGRALAAAVPGGVPALAAGAVVAIAGLASWWRRDAVALALMLAPVAVTAAAMVLTAHNLWPRLFFFAAGFAVLIVVRGWWALLERLAPARAPAWAPATLAAGALVLATQVPRAWGPKQDFAGARAWVERTARTGDTIVTVDMTRMPFREWLGTVWPAAESDSSLAALESAEGRTWVLTAFPARLRVVQPGLWERLQREYTVAARFPGTVGGGTIVVMVKGGA
jgi:4-amino-4-deoxy-L-arabinose transferase-like glycosyltransferase